MKQYLADGVYAEFTGWDITLTADSGGSTNVIYLDEDVLKALDAFRERIKQQKEKNQSC